jgi:cytochrome c-type biogenesis protein CcmH
VLKAQLGELETQAATGVLEAPEAEALKSDLKRRVLAEGRRTEAVARPLGERTLLYLALGTVAIVTLAGTGLYLVIGKPDVKAAPGAVATQMAAGPDGSPHDNPDTVIAQLETQMQQHPDNAEGWRMLGWSYLQTGRNAEAAEAYGKAAALDPKNADYLSAQGEATVLAAQGTVTPIAQGVFRKALAADPQDPRARYYLAVARDQAGDHEGAMNDWIALIKSAPPDAPWLPDVRTFVEKVAAERKIDLTGRLPAMAAAGPRGPTPEQMAAAQTMSEGDRAQMIQGMVSGLDARLSRTPRTSPAGSN